MGNSADAVVLYLTESDCNLGQDSGDRQQDVRQSGSQTDNLPSLKGGEIM